MASELNLPFTSHDPKIGDPPSLSWASFETPKLRRFPYPTQFEFLEWLGSGLDGIVVKVTAEEYPDPFVLKFFFNNGRPDDDEEYEYYWAFERECINAAIFELVRTSIKRAENNGQSIYLKPFPETQSDAIQNLKACSSSRPSISNAEENEMKKFPTTEDEEHAATSINECLGWLEMSPPPNDLVKTLTDLRNKSQGKQTAPLPKDRILCIAYAFVPAELLDENAVLSQADFMHRVGFSFDEVTPRNWRGKGVLVDFSDIRSYHIKDRFRESAYRSYSREPGYVNVVKNDIQKWNEELKEMLRKLSGS